MNFCDYNLHLACSFDVFTMKVRKHGHFELLLTNHNNNQEKQADFKMSNYGALKFLDLFPHAYVAFS